VRQLLLCLVLGLVGCQSNQRLHQGISWQRDLLLLHKQDEEKVIRVLFSEIERAYHAQVDERMARFMTKPMSEAEVKKLYEQANSQKLKITKSLVTKRDELLNMVSLDMSISLNEAMGALTGAKAEQEAMLNDVIGQERTKLLEQYTRKIPDLGRFLQ
jgi:hypothetical protein